MNDVLSFVRYGHMVMNFDCVQCLMFNAVLDLDSSLCCVKLKNYTFNKSKYTGKQVRYSISSHTILTINNNSLIK